MKKILFATIAALAITSCSQEEEYGMVQDSKIEFNGIVRNATKAAITTTESLEAFGVYGYRTAGDWNIATQLPSGFIENLKVTKTGDTWVSDNVFYWPYSEKVQFFATAPAQTLTLTATAPSFSYTVADTSTDQVDLLAASKLNANKEVGTIQFPFKHLLTQVNFTVKGDNADFTYTVTNIVLKGVKNIGTFTFDDKPTVGVWSAQTGSAEYTCGTNLTLTGVTPLKLETEAASLFMLLPQTDLTAATVEINYKAESKVGASDGFVGTKSATLSGAWEMGKRVRYTLELTCDATKIAVGDPTVDGWDTPETDTPIK